MTDLLKNDLHLDDELCLNENDCGEDGADELTSSEADEILLIREENQGRLDLYLTAKLEGFSRSHVQNMIKKGHILVNNKNIKAGYDLQLGDKITVSCFAPEILQVKPQNISLDILYEDEDIVVVNKAQGMVVHPAAGHYEDTLVNALLYHCGDLSGINGIIRPGIVHRIDKDTSGILVVAKNDAAHIGLTDQWKDHSIKRVYQALLHGEMNEPAGIIDAPIGRHSVQRKKMAVDAKNGRHAITHYRVLQLFVGYTLAEMVLETGRTHQIRVHMSYLKHPVVGDPLYGPRKCPFQLQGQALHAKVLGFHHPINGQWMEFDSPLPAYFQELLLQLKSR